VRVLASLLLLLLPLARAEAQALEGMDEKSAASLPPALIESLRANPGLKGYALDARLNPWYLRGDFDGDGKADTALLIKHKASGKTGIAIVHAGATPLAILGAGKEFGNGGDEFSWMDAWYVVPDAAKSGAEALALIRTESGGGIAHWNGKRYVWQQHGD
jgi:hypothetical protein